jgi:hypothetical protein
MLAQRLTILLPVILLASCGREPDAPVSDVKPGDETKAAGATDTPFPTLPAEAFENPAAAEAQRWITYQYLLNTPEEAPQRIGDFVRAGLLEANPDANAVEVLGVFLGLLGRANPGVLDGWVSAAAGLPADAQYLFAYAAWFAEPEKAGERLIRVTARMPQDDPRIGGILDLQHARVPDVAAIPLEAAVVLDLWWAAFVATGDVAWVDLVVGGLPPAGKTREESGFTEPLKIEIARAAVWSLVSNGFQHPRVYEHLKARRAAEPAAWPEIDVILAKIEEGLAAGPSPAP